MKPAKNHARARLVAETNSMRSQLELHDGEIVPHMFMLDCTETLVKTRPVGAKVDGIRC